MEVRSRARHKLKGLEAQHEGAGTRATVLILAGGQCVPWLYHTEIADDFVCMEGPMVVETRAPRNTYVLQPGQRCTVPAKTAHYVRGVNDGPCKFMIVQGVGVYDFVPVG